MTLHRPGSVDDPEILAGLLEALSTISKELPIIFPIHPRTCKMVRQFELDHYLNSGDKVEGIWCTEPLGYLEFLHLNMNARLVLTDSGGLQEETTVLGVPCITIRPNTERPITCTEGTNVLVGNDPAKVRAAAHQILHGQSLSGKIPEKWDGRAAERIVHSLIKEKSDAFI